MKIYKRLYFTCENIEYKLITSAFTVDFPQPTSIFKRYKRSKAQNMGIHLLDWIVRGLLVIRLSSYTVFYTFLTQLQGQWFQICKTTLFCTTHRHSKQRKGFVNITYRLRKPILESCYGESVSAHFQLLICTKYWVFQLCQFSHVPKIFMIKCIRNYT